MRLFELRRDVDETGISGTGVVAQGVVFDSGKVTLSWLTEHSSVAVYDSIEEVVAIHGHGGKTRVMQVCDFDVALAQQLRDNCTQDHMENVVPGCVSMSPNEQYFWEQREKAVGMFTVCNLLNEPSQEKGVIEEKWIIKRTATSTYFLGYTQGEALTWTNRAEDAAGWFSKDSGLRKVHKLEYDHDYSLELVLLADEIKKRVGGDVMSNRSNYDNRPPSEGTWSVFTQKVVGERDMARDRVAELEEAANKAIGHLNALLKPPYNLDFGDKVMGQILAASQTLSNALNDSPTPRTSQ